MSLLHAIEFELTPLTDKELVEFGLKAAKSVLQYAGELKLYALDCIQTTENWLKEPTEDNRLLVEKAAEAAEAAGWAGKAARAARWAARWTTASWAAGTHWVSWVAKAAAEVQGDYNENLKEYLSWVTGNSTIIYHILKPYDLTYYIDTAGEKRVQIGCLNHRLDHWLENYKKIGGVVGASVAEIARHGEIIKNLKKGD